MSLVITATMPSLDASLGAIEIGVIVSSALFGLLIVQCYTYYQADFKDEWFLKTLVSASKSR